MAYLLKRMSAAPDSPMRIMVQDKVNGDLLNSGGTFYFAPAGQPGDAAEVSEVVAKAVMTDPGLAQHFSCTPPLAATQRPAAPTAGGDQQAMGDQQPRKTRRRKAADTGGAAE